MTIKLNDFNYIGDGIDASVYDYAGAPASEEDIKKAWEAAEYEIMKERRLDQANKLQEELFSLNSGAIGVQHYIEEWLGADVGWEGWREWGNFFGYTREGYATAFCDSKKSDYFIQDYAGHYATDGGFPTMGAMIYANGRRSEYTAYDWSSTCTFNGESPKWFPSVNASGSENADALGYLYKISWYIGYPFDTDTVDGWTKDERESKGLERNGSIIYRIKLEGEACSAESLPSYYEFPNSEITKGSSASVTYSYYDKAYMKKICIIFDEFEFDGGSNTWCSDITSEELAVASSFVYFPDSTSTGSTSSGGSTSISSGSSTSSSSDCPYPAALCSAYGY